MAQLDLNEREKALLMEVLESSLGDLRTERIRTEKRDLHANVVERETFVADLLARLQRIT